MKAILFTEYGSPDVLQLQQVEKPTPNDKQVLIKVRAASANPLDWHHMRGSPFLVRMGGGLRKPKNTRLGADMAGQIEAVGKDVTLFKPGDTVYGVGDGAYAEYACASEDNLATKPANMTFEEAAAVPVAALTALQGLRDTGHIESGQKVLINGASGGVGTFAVQIAKAFGAHVTAVCSTRNLDLVRSIGADEVIDYTRQDFTRTGQRYDLIFDAVGNHSVSDFQRALHPNGRGVIAGFSGLLNLAGVIVQGGWVSKRGTQKIGLMGIAEPNQKDLAFLNTLLESGKVTLVIDRCYPLREVPEAIRYLETGHARGKVVVTQDKEQDNEQ